MYFVMYLIGSSTRIFLSLTVKEAGSSGKWIPMRSKRRSSFTNIRITYGKNAQVNKDYRECQKKYSVTV